MKKRFTSLVILALAFCASANAQWNTSATPAQFINANNQGDYSVCSPKFARTSDGKTWISYKTWDSHKVNDSTYYFDGVHTYLQLLDANGRTVFADPISLNASYKTPSWWSDYGLAVDKDGNAIVTVADSRSEEVPDSIDPSDYSSHQAFQPAIYKVDQNGNLLWGLDGISYPKYQDAPFTNVYVIGDDTYFQFMEISDSLVGTYVQRISSDGVPAWSEPKKLYGQLVPTTGTDFICFDDGGDGARATRYTRDLDQVWQVTYDSNSFGGHDLHPYKIATDGEGGAAVAFVRFMGQYSHNIRVQHISADGETTFGLNGIDAYGEESYDHDYCDIAVNPKNKEILVNWEDKINDDENQTVGKFNYDGDRLWGNTGIAMGTKTGVAYSWGTVGQTALADSSWIVAYTDVAKWADMSLIVKRLDANGKQIWKKTIGRSIDINDPQVFSDAEWTYVFWRESKSGAEGINGIRIHNTDGKYVSDGTTTGISSASTKTINAVSYYTLDGRRINIPQHGINIAKYADGRTVKFIK